MIYSLTYTRRFERGIKKVNPQYLLNIKQRVDALATDPRPSGCKKLVGLDDVYRIRIGIYRVLYQINDRQLLVVALDIDHRSRIYDHH